MRVLFELMAVAFVLAITRSIALQCHDDTNRADKRPGPPCKHSDACRKGLSGFSS